MRSVPRTVPVPNPTPLLFLIVSGLAWCILVISDPVLTTTLVVLLGVGVLLPAAILIFAGRPILAAVVLIAGTALPRFPILIASLNARPEHLAAGILLLVLPFCLTRRTEPIQWMAADFLLVAYMGMQFFSSVFMSIDPKQTLKWATQQTIVILIYFVLRVLIQDRNAFSRVFRALLLVGVLEAAYGIVCFYSNVLFHTEFGVTVGQYESMPATYGTQFEANILGSYSGACCCMLLVMYLRKPTIKSLIGFAITFAAMAISLSRGALLATILGLSAVVLVSWKYFNRQALRGLLFAMLGVIITVAPAVVGMWQERFSTMEVSDVSADADTRVRLLTMATALDGILEHPVAGNGTDSYQLQFNPADFGFDDAAAWIGNTEIRILYDTGTIGVALFTGFLISLAVVARKVLKNQNRPELLALLLASIVYAVAFQFTEGTLLGFTWVHLGLIAAAVSIYRRDDDVEFSQHGPQLQAG